MSFTRRNFLMSTLFGAGAVGLRALATGIPAAVLAKGAKKAFADGSACTTPQYFIMSTCGSGDPINANAPGCYATPVAGNPHSLDPGMAATPLTINGQASTAALPWTANTGKGTGLMAQNVLDRSVFWHIMTNTPVHPEEPNVLRLLGATAPSEMLPSLLARSLAPCLGTVQAQPITVGASTPSEGLSYSGQALPIIPPLALKATLASPSGPLAGVAALSSLRDQTLAQINDIYATTATKAQKAYLDSLVLSQQEVLKINQSLLDNLDSITDNRIGSQITAAIVLIQMNITPVIAIHIPFGGDNHHDTNLADETAQTIGDGKTYPLSGVGAIASLMSQLATATNQFGSLADQVSFMSLNVFGRTLGPANTAGRQHNPNHQLSLTIGKPFKGGIIGALGPVDGDFGATAFDAGNGTMVQPTDSLASFGKTVMTAVGADPAVINSAITSGTVVTAALNS